MSDQVPDIPIDAVGDAILPTLEELQRTAKAASDLLPPFRLEDHVDITQTVDKAKRMVTYIMTSRTEFGAAILRKMEETHCPPLPMPEDRSS